MKLTRRRLLGGTIASTTLAAAGGPLVSWAANGLTERSVPGTGAPFRVLEIFLAGGLSHRETLWVEQPDEAPVQRRLAALNPSTNPILAAPGAPSDWTRWLTGPGAYQGAGYRVGRSASGDVHLGPCGEPLVRQLSNGSRLIDRLRVIAAGHDLEPHEEAQELMMQGAPAITDGSRASGVGAAIGRQTGLPSYVFYTQRLADVAGSALYAAASGAHGIEWAPVLIPYDDPTFVANLQAPRVPSRDALTSYYADEYRKRLVFQSGPRARSRGFDRYVDSLAGAHNSPAFANALSQLTTSTGSTLWDNGTRRALKASIEVMNAGLSRYCCVVDGGYVGNDFGGFSSYDAHAAASLDVHAATNTGNLLNVLRTVHEEVDAGRLDLNNTLVVFSTEFGRTFSSAGSDHGYRGFSVAMLGGPIPPGAGDVVGDLPFTSADDGLAVERANPALANGAVDPSRPISATDLRAGVLLAAGIHPFQADVYKVSEAHVPLSLSRDAAADALGRHLFGV